MKKTLYLLLLLISQPVSAAAPAADSKNKPNRLQHETSPYLLQHAYNPVDWYPWGEEAFERARKENKPVLISIGYSTCHWCHVMARESFEDKTIAALLNKHFISIKVDREERPDIDRIYLTASEIVSGYGGWPTTVIATPTLKPFFATTYMPPFTKQGHDGFHELLGKVVTLWSNQRQRVEDSANEITTLIRQQLENKHTNGKLEPAAIELAYQHFKKSYDEEHGGFSQAPKFPRTPVYAFLLQYGQRNPDSQAHSMLRHTLNRILRSGLYDQVGGGFHRYSVDAQWQVPHFEKMLYDQGLMVNTLIDATLNMADTHYKQAIRHSLNFVLRQMHHDDGGFYSAYDADSTRPDNPAEHGEGAYYVWTQNELDKLLSTDEKAFIYRYFNIQPTGNVVSDPQQEFKNLNILYADDTIETVAKQLKIPAKKAQQLLDSTLQTLHKHRQNRPPPHLDDKIITSWNALVIRALARASKLLDEPRYLKAAEKSASFLYRQLYDPKTQTLYRSYRNGKHSGEAYLDDYAYLVQALLDLYRQTQNRQWLIWADTLMTTQIRDFYDTKHHGFFDNSGADKNILVRSKEIYDGALPSANAISVINLAQLGPLMEKPNYLKLAENTVNSFHEPLNELVENYPQMYSSYLLLQQISSR